MRIKYTPESLLPQAQRFWSKADQSGGCWLWLAATANYGYGAFHVRNLDGSWTLEKAHRIAWILAFGAIPDGLCVLHHCDTPACVRPQHLFLGSKADNSADMRAKGRSGGGKAKLTEEAVRIIRASTEMQRVLAARYGVARATIEHVRLGNTWRRVR